MRCLTRDISLTRVNDARTPMQNLLFVWGASTERLTYCLLVCSPYDRQMWFRPRLRLGHTTKITRWRYDRPTRPSEYLWMPTKWPFSHQSGFRICPFDGALLFILSRGSDLLTMFGRMREMRSVHSELMNFMLSEIERRKDELRTDAAGGRWGDFFTLLIEANENRETKLNLADHEVVHDGFLEPFLMFSVQYVIFR